jgi:hypothetical protein
VAEQVVTETILLTLVPGKTVAQAAAAAAHKRRIPQTMLPVLEHLGKVMQVVLLLTHLAEAEAAQALLDNPALVAVLVLVVMV